MSGLRLSCGKFDQPSDHRRYFAPNNSILAIEEDKDGYLWIGTWGGGLNRFDPARFPPRLVEELVTLLQQGKAVAEAATAATLAPAERAAQPRVAAPAPAASPWRSLTFEEERSFCKMMGYEPDSLHKALETLRDAIELVGEWPKWKRERLGCQQILERRLQQVGQPVFELHNIARRTNAGAGG